MKITTDKAAGTDTALPSEKQRRKEESFSLPAFILETGFSDTGVIPVENLHFYEETRRICESNQCRGYGATWACPPAVGTLKQCCEKVQQFQFIQLFSKVYTLEDSMDFEGMQAGMTDFKELVSQLDERLGETLRPRMILSNESCHRCAHCTYPDLPCRFPDKLYPSIEGFGFNVSELAGQAGIKYINGSLTVTYFGAVLF